MEPSSAIFERSSRFRWMKSTCFFTSSEMRQRPSFSLKYFSRRHGSVSRKDASR